VTGMARNGQGSPAGLEGAAALAASTLAAQSAILLAPSIRKRRRFVRRLQIGRDFRCGLEAFANFGGEMRFPALAIGCLFGSALPVSPARTLSMSPTTTADSVAEYDAHWRPGLARREREDRPGRASPPVRFCWVIFPAAEFA